MALNATQQFSASSNGTPVANVTWAVNGVAGGNATVGTISTGGLYTGPANFPSPNTFQVLAVSQADATKTATANLAVVYPANNRSLEAIPISLGTSGGNATDFVVSGTTKTCCSGTLGSLVSRAGTLFILSNNHVLAKSDNGTATTTDVVSQPGLVDNACNPGANTVAHFSQAAPLKPVSGTTGPAPSNVDAAIAQIVAGTVDAGGSILDLGTPATATSIPAGAPSATLTTGAAVLGAAGHVAKSGRSSGLTCSTLTSVTTTVQVQYDANCGGAVVFTSQFSGQIVIAGGSFSSSGDSGSLIVDASNARPVGLLYAGDTSSTVANPIQDVLAAFQSGANAATMVGGADHAVTCITTVGAILTVPLSAQLTASEIERTTGIANRHSAELKADPAVSRVEAGVSADSRHEGALVITLNSLPNQPIPATIEGLRTRVVLPESLAGTVHLTDAGIASADPVRALHTASLMAQSGTYGVGVGQSGDNPAEPAIVIYIKAGQSHAPIPAVIDGIRTRIIEGDGFRSFGWGKQTVAQSCSKPQVKTAAAKR